MASKTDLDQILNRIADMQSANGEEPTNISFTHAEAVLVEHLLDDGLVDASMPETETMDGVIYNGLGLTIEGRAQLERSLKR